MPGALEEMPGAEGAQLHKHWGTPYPPPQTPLQSSLGSEQQESPVWEPADPVMSLETLCCLPLILCGF